MDVNVWQLALSLVIGLMGIAAGYGAVRVQGRRNTIDISALRRDMNTITGNPSGQSVFVRRSECEAYAVDRATMERKLSALMNFARHVLTTDKKMSLQKVNEILGED